MCSVECYLQTFRNYVPLLNKKNTEKKARKRKPIFPQLGDKMKMMPHTNAESRPLFVIHLRKVRCLTRKY